MKKSKTKNPNISLGAMKQTHGQVETVPQKLSEIIAAKNGEEVAVNFGPYKTQDAEAYAQYVSGLSRADLEAHCSRVGVIPAGESKLIAKKLVTEFKRFWQGNAELPRPIKFTQEQKDKFKNIKF